jgi:hypothetical protein
VREMCGCLGGGCSVGGEQSVLVFPIVYCRQEEAIRVVKSSLLLLAGGREEVGVQ